MVASAVRHREIGEVIGDWKRGFDAVLDELTGDAVWTDLEGLHNADLEKIAVMRAERRVDARSLAAQIALALGGQVK